MIFVKNEQNIKFHFQSYWANSYSCGFVSVFLDVEESDLVYPQTFSSVSVVVNNLKGRLFLS